MTTITMPMRPGQLDLAKRRLPRQRRRTCDVCGRVAPLWELTLSLWSGDRFDDCLTERRCDQHVWGHGRSGTISVSFHDTA
jgi:hypothetical protein